MFVYLRFKYLSIHSWATRWRKSLVILPNSKKDDSSLV